jgi:hypothetical protein
MALIIETGAGVPNASSYVSVAEASAYLGARGLDAAWADLDTLDQEALLARACDYMQAAYRGRWKGYRCNDTQALDWPRQGVLLTDLPYGALVQYTTIPREVKQAQIELALRQLADRTTPLMQDLTRGVLAESVGSLSTTYDIHSPQQVRYAQVDSLLSPYLTSSGVMVRLGRS